MMFIKRIKLILFLVIFTCSFAYTQRSQMGQIILGDTASFTANIDFTANWPDNILVRFPGEDHYDIFAADEITEFVLNTEDVFRAKPLITHDGTKKIVFMQLLSGGSIDLYHSSSGPFRFYVQKEELIPLSRDNYRETVTGLVVGDTLAYEASQRVLFRKNSLRHFFRQYNKDRLRYSLFPMPHAGLYFQFNSMRWNIPRQSSSDFIFNSFDLPVNHFSPGLFVHFPFYQPIKFGLDLRFAAHSYETTFSLVEERLAATYFKDVYFENSWIQADLALRYTIAWGPFEPYLAFGFSYVHSIRQRNKVFYFLLRDGVVTSHFKEDIYNEPSLLFGVMVYQGLQYFVFPRTVIAAEWGYGHYIDASGSGYGMNNLFANIKLNFWPW